MAGTHHVFFTVANKGTFYGVPSNVGWERGMEKWFNVTPNSPLNSFVTKGFILAAGSGLSVDIGTTDVSGTGESGVKGEAVISGRIVQLRDGSENLGSLTNNKTTIDAPNYIYIQLTRVSNLVTEFSYVANTSGTAPTDSVCIGIVTTSGGVVTAVIESKVNPDRVVAQYTGAGGVSSTKHLFLGFKPKRVSVSSPNTTPTRYAISGFTVGSAAVGSLVDSTPAAKSSANLYDRPEIYDWGFKVGNDGSSNGLNESTKVYDYLAEA